MAQLYKVFLWSLCTIMSGSGISLIRVLTFQSSRPYVSMYVYICSETSALYTRISLFCLYSLQIRLDIIIRLSVILGTCFLALGFMVLSVLCMDVGRMSCQTADLMLLCFDSLFAIACNSNHYPNHYTTRM